MQQTAGSSRAEVAEARQTLGRVLLRLQRPAAAQLELDAALKLRERETLADPIELGGTLVLVAEGLVALKQPAEALLRLDRALQIKGNREVSTDRLHAEAYFVQAKALHALDQARGVRPLCARAQAALALSRSGYLRVGLSAHYDLQELEAWSKQTGCL